MPYKVVNNNGGISGTFSRMKDASRYAKSKGLKFHWFFDFQPLDELIAKIKTSILK